MQIWDNVTMWHFTIPVQSWPGLIPSEDDVSFPFLSLEMEGF